MRRGEFQPGSLRCPGELGFEDSPIQEEPVGQTTEEGADRGLLLAARRLVLGLGWALLAGPGQVDEGALVVEPRDPLGAGLEIEPKRPFHRDLAKAEPGGGIDAADDHLPFLAVIVHLAGRAVLEVLQQPQDVLLAVERDLAAFGAQALSQQDPERRGVDELDLAAPLGPFPVREHPDVGGDPRVVEELLGQRDERLEQVVLKDPAPDLALAAAGIAREERRAVHDDGDPRAALGRLLGVGEHVEQEQELAVADPRQARCEAAGSASIVLAPYCVLVALPVFAVGRIGDHVVEGPVPACRSFESVLPNRIFFASRPSFDFMKRSDLQIANVSGFTSWPNRWM